MDKQKIIQEITAFADGELKSGEKFLKIKSLTETDPEYRFEFDTQKQIHHLLNDRFSGNGAPDYLKQKIQNDLKAIALKNGNTADNYKITGNKGFNPDRKLIFAAAFVFLAIAVMFFLPGSFVGSKYNISDEQGEYNIVARAKNNFSKVTGGAVSPEYRENNPVLVKNYFKDKGIRFDAMIPQCANWQITGSYVSECKGEKLAHTIYQNKKGNTAYLFQVDERCSTVLQKLTVSEGLEEKIGENKYLGFTENNNAVFIWKKNGIIGVLISDSPADKIERGFIVGNL